MRQDPSRVARLAGEGLKHNSPLHASHLSEIVSPAAANHNKQDGGQQKRFGGKPLIFLSLVPLTSAFQCLGLLLCTLLIERSHQRQLTLKAALEYNAVLSPRLAGTNRLHGKRNR